VPRGARRAGAREEYAGWRVGEKAGAKSNGGSNTWPRASKRTAKNGVFYSRGYPISKLALWDFDCRARNARGLGSRGKGVIPSADES